MDAGNGSAGGSDNGGFDMETLVAVWILAEVLLLVMVLAS